MQNIRRSQSDNLFLFGLSFHKCPISSEAEENRSVNGQVNRINNTDYKRFKWAFLKYMCEVNRPVTAAAATTPTPLETTLPPFPPTIIFTDFA
jgi:hypothetical protein